MGVIFCIYVCSRYLYLLPMVFRRGCQIFWNWIYRQLWDFMWVLEIEFGSSSRAQRYFTAVSIHSFHLNFSSHSVSHWSWSLPIQWPNANKKQSESRWVYFRLKGQEDSVYDGREDMTAEVWGGLSQCIFNQEAEPDIKL